MPQMRYNRESFREKLSPMQEKATQKQAARPAAESRKPAAAKLRTGFSTGACATAAVKAALTALIRGSFPNPVSIILPKGQTARFPLSFSALGKGSAAAAVIKDAGDDPDITNGAAVQATVRFAPPGSGIIFRAGKGVGTVTRAGLPLPIGEAAINPVPRRMMTEIAEGLCAEAGLPADCIITISIPNGEELAAKTWNPRLGIIGGLSILGTTGIVRPYSCSAWIYSIQQSIDVARANGQPHCIAATGSTSLAAAQKFYEKQGEILPDYALIDMGDFAGAVLKYVKRHKLQKLTLAGGFAKFCKLAQGAMDLHSSRSQVDKVFLWTLAEQAGLSPSFKEQIINANTAKEILDIGLAESLNLGLSVAEQAKKQAMLVSGLKENELDIIVTDRKGKILACM